MPFRIKTDTYFRLTAARLYYILLNLFVLTSISLYAEERKISITGPPFPPFSNIENNKVDNIGSLLCELIFDNSKIDFDLHFYPYARMLHNLKFGVTDIAFCFKNEGLADYVHYIGPVSKFKIIVVAKEGVILKEYDDLKDLNGIGMISHARYSPRFDTDSTLKKVHTESYVQAVNMLNSKRIEGVIGSFLGLKYAFNKLGLPSDNFDRALVINEKEVWLHLSKKSDFLFMKDFLDSRIKKLYKADLLKEIYEENNKTSFDR